MGDAVLARSLLYLPAANARAIEKARSLPADVVILDLEDAVAPDAKIEARAAAIAAAATGTWGWRRIAIRVNAAGTPWHAEDMAEVAASAAQLIVVPKVDSATDAGEAVVRAGGKPVWAMIETPRAVQRVDAIADVAGIEGLIAGFNDLAKELRIRPEPDRTALLYPAGRMINAARAADIAVFDGVFGDIRDADGLIAEAQQGSMLGFDGKTCIHPGQLDIVNSVFSPSADAIAEAEGIVAAFAAAKAEGKGVTTYKGRMIEGLHAEAATRLLQLARAATERTVD